MSTYPLMQFVDAPSATANLLFDFSDKTASVKRYPLKEGLSLGAPELDGDVDAVDARYLPRTVAFTVRVNGTKSAAIALQSTIARQVLYGPGWLRFQMSAASKTVYFRTYRAAPGELEFTVASADSTTDVYDVAVSFPAEPFAYGELVTQTAQTVTNDPAAAAISHPLFFGLNPVTGDAPTRLQVKVDPSVASPGHRYLLALHAVSTATGTGDPVVVQFGTSDGITAGTDTGAASTTGGSAYSGGSYRPITFATNAGMVSRAINTVGGVRQGRYKVLLRIARTDTSSVFQARFGTGWLGSAFGYEYGPTVTTARAASTATGHATYLDLGDFTLPVKYGPSALESASFSGNLYYDLQVARVSGAGSANIDALVLIPVEYPDTAGFSALGSFFPNTGGLNPTTLRGVFDGVSETVWGAGSSANTYGSAKTQNDGVFLTAYPGMNNWFYFVQQVNGGNPIGNADASDAISHTASVTMSYYPRYLYIGDS